MHPINDHPWVKKMQALEEKRTAGSLTDAQYERQQRALWMELQQTAQKERAKTLAWALDTGKVQSEAQYKTLCAHYHDEYGDSFHHFLTSIQMGAAFVTLNDKILDDAPFLQAKYGGKILTPEQAATLAEQEKTE